MHTQVISSRSHALQHHLTHFHSSQDVINGFKVLCGDAPAMPVVEIVKDLTGEDAKFVDTQCNWPAACHWALWWLQPSHLQMLHVD